LSKKAIDACSLGLGLIDLLLLQNSRRLSLFHNDDSDRLTQLTHRQAVWCCCWLVEGLRLRAPVVVVISILRRSQVCERESAACKAAAMAYLGLIDASIDQINQSIDRIHPIDDIHATAAHSSKATGTMRPPSSPSISAFNPHRLLLLPPLVLLLLACSVAQAFLLLHLPSSSSPSSSTIMRHSSRLGATAARPDATAPLAAATDGDGGETTRLRLGVYIEHTDRYGVVYNSQYLLFLNRCVCVVGLSREEEGRRRAFRWGKWGGGGGWAGGWLPAYWGQSTTDPIQDHPTRRSRSTNQPTQSLNQPTNHPTAPSTARWGGSNDTPCSASTIFGSRPRRDWATTLKWR
jgi:hypothetical protein